MKLHFLALIALLFVSERILSQPVAILRSNPSNAYAALVSSDFVTTSGPEPVDLLSAAWTAGGTPGAWRSYFRLNDSALAGITIDSAILQLYADPVSSFGITGSPTYGTDNTSVLYRVTGLWDTTISWMTIPSYTSVDSVILPQSTSTVENYLDINVTALLNDIISSGFNYGFMLKSRQETTPYNSMIFYSSSAADSSVRPQILIYGHGANHPPHFTGGHTQSLTVCVNETDPTTPINSLLAVIDTDLGQTETWSLVTPPSHATALVAYTATSTGGTIVPTGLTYAPVGGYTGTDMFIVSVTDGIATDTTTINVTVNAYPNAGIISGADSVCPGQTVGLFETAFGGIWSTSSFTISDINSSGTVQGLVPGADTIIYSVSNACGIVSTFFPFLVRSYDECHTGVNALSDPGNDLKIYPNPANDELNISSQNKIASIAITNLVGQTLYTHECSKQQVRVDVAGLPDGVYFIKVNGTEVRKFVKQ